MSLSYSDVDSFVYGNLELPITTGGKWNARCPFCHDSKKNKFKRRFWLTYESAESVFYHCFNCEEKGTFYRLYSHVLGGTPEEAYQKFNRFDKERIRKRFMREEDCRNAPETRQDASTASFENILDDCVTKPEGFVQKQLVAILDEFRTRRKVDSDYPLYVAYKGRFAKRIIIPVIENGKIIYFQGRAIAEGMEPKYFNPTAEKSKIILNREHFSRDKYIIVTEGLLDAMSVEDHQGTSCLGASLQDDFLSSVTKYTDCGLIIALDTDETGLKKLEKFMIESKWAHDVRYFIMPDSYSHIKDLNQLKEENAVSNIYSFVLENSLEHFKTLLKVKMMKHRTT